MCVLGKRLQKNDPFIIIVGSRRHLVFLFSNSFICAFSVFGFEAVLLVCIWWCVLVFHRTTHVQFIFNEWLIGSSRCDHTTQKNTRSHISDPFCIYGRRIAFMYDFFLLLFPIKIETNKNWMREIILFLYFSFCLKQKKKKIKLIHSQTEGMKKNTTRTIS